MFKVLQVPPRLARKVSQQPVLAGQSPKVLRFADLYYDTPDFQLKGKGLCFCRRMQGRREVLRLAQIDGGLELVWKEMAAPRASFDFSASPSVPERDDLIVMQHQLNPVFSIVYQRRCWSGLSYSGGTVEVCADLGQIKCGDATQPFCELRLSTAEFENARPPLDQLITEISTALELDVPLASPTDAAYEMLRLQRHVAPQHLMVAKPPHGGPEK